MISIPTPEDFRPKIREDKIDVLSLMANPKTAQSPGWCTYTYEHESAPELEVLSGGVNHKTPRAGAIWRQGHLLHFGFEPSPDQMTEAGQQLLINAICYIARFTDDRPIVHTPCVFVQGKRLFDRGVLGRLIDDPARKLDELKYYLAPELHAKLAKLSRTEVADTLRGITGYLHADAEGKLTVDTDAEKLGESPAATPFFDKAFAALADPARRPLALRLLARYAPDGPGSNATDEQWRTWHRDNASYLFFSDMGGYRWFIDPLAKQRQLPTAQLRGPARATRAAVARKT